MSVNLKTTSEPQSAAEQNARLDDLLELVDRELAGASRGAEMPKWDYATAFSRHVGLLTTDEQERLRNSRIAIVGMGGVGGIDLVTLARQGIGRFTIADHDRFELANFNRQYGARLDTLGRSKAHVMAEEVRRINPEVEIRVFDEAIRPETVADFLNGADLFVDGIDFFALEMRRRLHRHAAANGTHAIIAGPIGFSAAWLTFSPTGIGFDEFFDMYDGQPELEALIAFATGLTPALLQLPYIDLRHVSLTEGRGPSAALACQLCAGVVAAEALKILLGRGGVRCVPWYSQFDPYRNKLRQSRLRWGNRGPVQRFVRWWLKRRLSKNSKSLPQPAGSCVKSAPN
ncbi:MAG: ThiF family adenylyltransferase [Planctomycetaceae bacterium]